MLGRYTTGPFCGGAEDSRPGVRCRTEPVRPRGHGTIPPVKRLPLAVAVGALLVAVAGSALGWGAPSSGASPSASPAGVAAGALAGAPGSVAAVRLRASGPSRLPPAAGRRRPNRPARPPRPITAAVPIVPVAQFRTTVQSIGRDDVRAAIAGTEPDLAGPRARRE